MQYANNHISQLSVSGHLAPHPDGAGVLEQWVHTGDDLVRLRFERKGICPGPGTAAMR